MKRSIKSAIFFCLYFSGLEWLLARLIHVRAVAMLMYHGVCESTALPPHIDFHIRPRAFERQMRALKSRYRVVPLGELVTSLTNERPLEKAIVITFDDGYRNNACYAAPVLKDLQLPYTVFVATGYVQTDAWMPLNELYWIWSAGKVGDQEMNALRQQLRSRPHAEAAQVLAGLSRPKTKSSASEDSFAMLNWDDIREMSRNGAEFGSHTHSHCNMAVESDAQQHAELQLSKELLETQLNAKVRLFAYPYGRAAQMSEASRQNVIAAGYQCAVTAEYGLITGNSDRFALPRIGYDQYIWNFTGEILYQFARQAAREIFGRPVQRQIDGRGLAKAKEHRG